MSDQTTKSQRIQTVTGVRAKIVTIRESERMVIEGEPVMIIELAVPLLDAKEIAFLLGEWFEINIIQAR